jgi:MYXO-CTERM domain-containing protein
VYLDARTGEPLARRSLLRWAELEYVVWQRSPIGPRSARPAAYIETTVDGVAQVTSPAGGLVLPSGGATVVFGTDGVYARVYDVSGPLAGIATPMTPDQIFTWDLGDDPQRDAQLNAYIHAQTVKDYVRGIDPGFAPLELETAVTVNIDDVCNAYADGNTINFFLSGSGCQNSALVADVVYHEYGHVAHTQGIIPGVGLFNGAHSEGASDYLSATIVDDPDVGRGFFLGSDQPIRELDPDGFEWRWPDDIGPVHAEGRIIGGTLWDLREVMRGKYGSAQGTAMVDRIWLDGLRRAVDIPSTYLEALISNDDDGNLQNGTPDICEINQVFAAHGLYQPPGVETAVTQTRLPDGSMEVTLTHGLPFAGCPEIIEPTGVVHFRPRAVAGQSPGPATELIMTELQPGTHRAVIPAQPQLSVTQFQVDLDWGNGTVANRPDNFGDPWYEYFSGDVTEIFCTDFEDPAQLAGWDLTGQWQWGAPEGGSGDPAAAYDGVAVLGTALAFPGLYAPFGDSRVTLPTLDVGSFEVVRLQYQRWLTVEDGYWDRATISANGEQAWANYASADEWLASVHHRDREWRFHDVELSEFIGPDGLVTLEFGLVSDAGLEFGGWNLDRLCVVGHGLTPAPGVCGDGIVQPFEQCDDGNLVNGDGCSSGCLIELPKPEPEPVLDDGWEPDGRGCGCSASEDGSGPAGGLVGLALFGIAGLLVRRRPLRG